MSDARRARLSAVKARVAAIKAHRLGKGAGPRRTPERNLYASALRNRRAAASKRPPVDRDGDGRVFDGTAREMPAPQRIAPLARRRRALARKRESPKLRAKLAERIRAVRKRTRETAPARLDAMITRHRATMQRKNDANAAAIGRWEARQHANLAEWERSALAAGRKPDQVATVRERVRGKIADRKDDLETEARERHADRLDRSHLLRRQFRRRAKEAGRRFLDDYRAERRDRRAEQIRIRRAGSARAYHESRLNRQLDRDAGMRRLYDSDPAYRSLIRKIRGLD